MLKDVEIAGKKSKKQLSKGINALVEEYMKVVSTYFSLSDHTTSASPRL